MSQWTGQTLIALLGGFALAFVLVLPFVARSYRIRGAVGVGRAVMGLAFLVYALALVTYTLLPQPVVDAEFCAANTALAHPVSSARTGCSTPATWPPTRSARPSARW
jgi:hypothetical protein